MSECDRQLTGVWLSQAIFTKVIDGAEWQDTSRDLITAPWLHLKYMLSHIKVSKELLIKSEVRFTGVLFYLLNFYSVPLIHSYIISIYIFCGFATVLK